tara:strand:- start:5109 stop:5981 length:873 start_codon:yes stop_codon:yes gene_type:complete
MTIHNPKLLTEVLRKISARGWDRGQQVRAEKVCEMLGTGILVNEVNEIHIEQLCTTLEARGLSGSTINRYLASLSKMLRYALKKHAIYYMDRMPHIEWHEEGKARVRYMLPEEEKEMIRILRKEQKDDYLNFFLFLLDTGMRLSEALYLKVANIGELENEKYAILEDTKNGDTRSVPLTERAAGIVETYSRHSERNDRIFNLNVWKVERAWRSLRESMGLEDDKQFVIHCLRHTCASRLAQSGKVELHLIQNWLGHRTYAMTQRYAHLKPSSLLGATGVLNALQKQSSNG